MDKALVMVLVAAGLSGCAARAELMKNAAVFDARHAEPRCKTDPALYSVNEEGLIAWAKYCWGGVTAINTTETKAGRHDQVVVSHGYDCGRSRPCIVTLYYYFENGRMTAMQRSPG